VAEGSCAPGALHAGLAIIPAHKASLLLGLETVITLLIAVGFRHERIPPRAWTGIALLVGGGLLVAIPTGRGAGPDAAAAAATGAAGAELGGALLIVLACAGWAIDSNATATIAGKNATVITLGWRPRRYLCLAAGRPASPLSRSRRASRRGSIRLRTLRLFILGLRHLGAAMTTGIFARSSASCFHRASTSGRR
jgi:hypothetical protein